LPRKKASEEELEKVLARVKAKKIVAEKPLPKKEVIEEEKPQEVKKESVKSFKNERLP